MIIDFPNQLTNEEEQLLKKIAKMKKKRKTYQEKKAAKDAQMEAQSSAAAAAAASSLSSSSLKRANSNTAAAVAGKQIDAKEAAKKLIQSGVIKLETENKEKGFKRSCSRKDEIKKIVSDESHADKPVSYSSVNSPMASPLSTNSPSQNKFFFDSNNSGNRPNYSRNFQFSQTRNFRNNSFNSGQTPTGSDSPNSAFRFPRNNAMNNNNNNSNNSNNNKPPNQAAAGSGVSLYIKANNISEELLRSIFSANVSSAKINSIEVKTNFAFVNVETKESAEQAIQELNGKVFNENTFSVSFARPRKTFNRNTSYERNEYDRQMGGPGGYEQTPPPPQPMNISYSSNSNPSSSPGVGMPSSSPVKSGNSSMDQGRQMINYEDI